MSNNTAEYLQIAYDQAVYHHGAGSAEANEAEAAAKRYFARVAKRTFPNPNKRVDGPRLVSTPSPVAST